MSSVDKAKMNRQAQDSPKTPIHKLKHHAINHVKRNEILYSSIAIVLILLVLFNVNYTGHTISLDTVHTDHLGLNITQSTSYTWTPENEGLLKSVKISGRLIGDGSAKIILVTDTGEYVIGDTSTIKEQGSNLITANVISNETETNTTASETIEERTENFTQETPIIEEEIIVEEPITQENLTIEEPVVENETEVQHVDNFSTQETEPPIGIVMENISEVVEENITLIENITENIGVELNEMIIENITEEINVTINETNSTPIINETIIEEIYQTAPLAGNVTEEIIIEETTNQIIEEINSSITDVVGTQEIIIKFNNICEETCQLPNLNSTNHTIKVILENAVLIIEKITYSTIIPKPEKEDIINETIKIKPKPIKKYNITTNFDNHIDKSNICDAQARVDKKAIVKWKGCVNASGIDINKHMDISDNYVYVDSETLDESFNSSAEITFFYVNLTKPKILEDGKTCTHCTIILHDMHNITFSVRHFSNYTVIEDSCTEWENGTYLNTACSDGKINITADNAQGNYTSAILDAGSLVSFTSIIWEETSGSYSINDTQNIASNDTYHNTSLGSEPVNLWDNNLVSSIVGVEAYDWVEFRFDTNRTLYKAGIYGDDDGSWICTDWNLAYWNHTTSSWVDIFAPESCFGIQWFNKTFTPITADRILLNITSSDFGVQAFEFFMYEQVNYETDIILKTRTSKDNITWEGWTEQPSNPSGTIDSSARYLQYMAEFSTGKINSSPSLSSVNISYVTKPPEIGFQGQTPENGTIQEETYVEINVSINETNLKESIFNWDGTNYTVYNDSLVLMYNMDENGELTSADSGLWSGLVGLWHFDGNANDASGNGNDGVILNGADCTDRPAKFDDGCYFAGDNDLINISDDPTLEGMGELTVSAWIKGNGLSSGNFKTVVVKEVSYLFTIDPAGGILGVWDGNGAAWDGRVISSTVGVQSGVWTHIAFTTNATGTYAYINGVERGTGASFGGIPSNTKDVNIGHRIGYTQPFNGSIDEVAIWNRSLSASEISELYSKGFVEDASNSGNNGEIFGPDSVSGKHGSALDFDGVNDYVNVTDFTWTNGGPITVSFWNKVDSSQLTTAFTFTSSSVSTNRFSGHVPWSTGILYWDYGDITANGRISTSYSNYLDKWTYVTLVSEGVSGNYKAIYLDGKEIINSSVSDGPDGTLNSMIIGASNTGASNFHKGTIDEFRIWDRVLSAEEIQQQYFMNLKKYSTYEWELYINQSKNSTEGLDLGTYTYKTYATDSSDEKNSTDTMTVTITDYLTSCAVLNTPGTYVLGSDIQINGSTCFDLNADGITLDCNGYSITGNNSNGHSAIYADSNDNIVVQNCNIYDYYYGVRLRYGDNLNVSNIYINNSLQVGLYYYNTNHGTLTNFTITNTISYYALYLNGANNHTAYDFTLENNYGGLNIDASINNTIYDFTSIKSTSGSGLAFYPNGELQASRNNIYDFNILNNSNYGIYFSTSSNNTLNNFTSSYNLNDNIYFTGADSNTLYNFTVSFADPNGADDGIRVYNSKFNIFYNFNLYNNSQYGIILDDLADNNTFYDFTLYNNTASGIWFDAASNNILYSFTSFNNQNSGIYIDHDVNGSKGNILHSFSSYGNIQYGLKINTNCSDNTIYNFSAYDNLWDGVQLGVKSYNNILYNFTSHDNIDEGIELGESSSLGAYNNTLYDFNIYLNGDVGLLLNDNSKNNTFYNFNSYNNTAAGIFFDGATNNTLYSFTTHNNDAHGLYLDVGLIDSEKNTLYNFSAYNNSDYGIVMAKANNNTIHNFTLYDNYGGLYNDGGSYNTFFNFTIYGSTTGSGFVLDVYAGQGANWNNVTDFWVHDNDNYGMFIGGSYNNTVYNFLSERNGNDGVYIGTSQNNTIYDFTSTNNSDENIYISNSMINLLYDFTASYANDNGIKIFNSSENTLHSFTSHNNTNNGILLDQMGENIVYNGITYENNNKNLYLLNTSDNIFYNNSFGTYSDIYTTNGFTNSFNSSLSGYNVGNWWDDVGCRASEMRGEYEVCTSPIYTINATNDEYDYAPLTSLPKIEFQGQTPENGTVQTEGYVEINVSINETNLKEVVFEWNETNTTVYDDSLVLMMNFDNISELGENDSYVVDISGNNNDGNCSGSTCPTWTSSGKYRGAYIFDGIDDSINSGINKLDFFGEDFSIFLWIKRDEFSQFMTLIDKRQANDNGYRVYLGTDNTIGCSLNAIDILNSSVTIADSDWHHIGCIANRSGYGIIYLDGIRQDLTMTPISAEIISSTHNLVIGKSFNGAGAFNGSMDELNIWNRTLTDIEIQQMYFTNLRKYDTDKWELYINQSKDSTTGLDDGTYTYQAFALDSSDNQNSTETRIITIDSTAPNITNVTILDDVTFEDITEGGTFEIGNNITLNVTVDEINLIGVWARFWQGLVTLWEGMLSDFTTYWFAEIETNTSWLGEINYSINASDEAGNTAWYNGTITGTMPTLKISFQGQTPENDTLQKEIYVEVNITINSSILEKFVYTWNETNTTCIIKTPINTGDYSCTDYEDDNLLIALNFDNDSFLGENDTYYVDLSGRGHNGTCVGANCPVYNASGKYGSGRHFTNDYISIPDSNDWNIPTNGEFAVSFWARPEAGIGSYAWVFDQQTTRVAIGKYNSAWDFYIGSTHLTGGTVTTGVWTHVVAVRTSTQKILYVNGKYVNSGASTAAITSSEIVVGQRYDKTGVYPFVGMLDEFRMWNRSLSAEEVNQLYLAKLRKYDSNTWDFYINQTKNGTSGLDDGIYTYQAYAIDQLSMTNQTEERIVTIDSSNPIIGYQGQTPPDYQVQTELNVEINISINDTHLDEVIFNWNGTNYSVYDDSLVLMYNLDNISSLGENNSLVKDLSGYGNDAYWQGDANPDSDSGPTSSGRYNGAFMFDGSDYMNTSYDSSLDFRGNITIAVWFNPSVVNNNLVTDFGLPGVTDGKYWLSTDGSQNFIEFGLAPLSCSESYSNQIKVRTSPNSILTDTWYHAVAKYNGTHTSIYLDGTIQNSTSYTNGLSSCGGRVSIGTLMLGTPSYLFNGRMDEVRIWNRSLTDSEIQQQYFTNLQKYDTYKWELYVNQSKNKSNGLDEGTYTYKAYAIDLVDNSNQTEERTLIIDNTSPEIAFEGQTPDDGTLEDHMELNVSINESNLKDAILSWNGTNYSYYEDLILMYNFDNISSLGEDYSSSVSTIVDLSTRKHDGTTYSTLGEDLVDGKYGKAFSYDTGNGYIDVEDSTDFAFGTGDFTISFWIYPSATGATFVNYATTNKFHALYFDTSTSGRVISDNANRITGIVTQANIWQHYTLVRNGSSLKAYINGVQSGTNGSVSGLSIGASTVNRIGASNSGTHRFTGRIDEMRIWNKALSIDEIDLMYRMNLRKYDIDKWELTANMTGSDDGTYAYKAYVIDQVDNVNSTEIRTITLDSTGPAWFGNTTNITANSYEKQTYFNITFNETYPDKYIFSWYNGSSWQNDTPQSYSSNTEISVTKTINLNNVYIYWKWYVNDTIGNQNTTPTWSQFMDNLYPAISFQGQTKDNGTIQRERYVEANISIRNASDLSEVVFSWNASNYTIYDDSLVLMMNFNKLSALGENESYFNDMSMYGNNGTCKFGSSCPLWTSDGKYGGANIYDGIDDYIEIGDDTSLSLINLTISAWVMMTTNQTGYIATRSSICGVRGWMPYGLRINSDGKVQYDVKSTASCSSGYNIDEYRTNSNITFNTWHHITVTSTNNNVEASRIIKFYIDGVESSFTQPTNGNTALAYSAAGYTNFIGANSKLAGYYTSFKGKIDEVRIWNRALSAAEIQEQYFINLEKYDGDKWELYVNQSKNLTDGLDDGTYTYQTYAIDSNGNINSTDLREITISDIPVINFVNVSDIIRFNATIYLLAHVTDNNLIYVNFTLISPEGEIFIDNLNGSTSDSIIWNSSSITLNETGTYNYTLIAGDTDGYQISYEGKIEMIILNFSLIPNSTITDSLIEVSGHINLTNGSDIKNKAVDVYIDGILQNSSWFDPDWHYRKEVILYENSGSNLEGFQVNISIDTETLIDQGKMQNDCDDIRITDANDTLLPYWIKDSSCYNTDTIIWVKANLTASSNSTMYIYYGNDDAYQAGSEGDVFEFIENGEDQDVSAWSETYESSVNNVGAGWSYIFGTSFQGKGDYSVELKGWEDGGAWSGNGFGNRSVSGAGQNIDFSLKWIDGSGNNNYRGSGLAVRAVNSTGGAKWISYRFTKGTWSYTYPNSCTVVDVVSGTAGNWYDISRNVKIDMNSLCSGFNVQNITHIGMWIALYAGYEYTYLDNVRIYKYTTTLPTQYVMEEETYIYSTDEYGNFTFNITSPSSEGIHNITINITYSNIFAELTRTLEVIDSTTPPNITSISSRSATPNEGTTVDAYILFNVTDDNGADDINETNSHVNLTYGATIRPSSICVEYSDWSGELQKGINCTVPMDYYDTAGLWNITIRAIDNANLTDIDNTSTFTYNILYAFRLTQTNIMFNGSSGQYNINSTNDQMINNTGNGYFQYFNITAQRLDGPDSNTIGPGNFTVNATDDSIGITLETTKLIPSLTLDTLELKTIYLWMDIPAAIPNGQYNSSDEWIIEAYN